MNEPLYETDVLIAGGGPVGLALALDLAYRGIDHVVIDEGDGVVRHPKVSTVGPRSMEHFRRWGVADRIRAAGWPDDHPLDIAWVIRVGEHEIHRFERGTVRDRPAFTHTPEPDQVCPGHWLNPLLANAVGIHPEGPLRYRCRIERIEQDSDAVRATVRDHARGTTMTVVARFLVACDGSSSPIRKAVGINAPARYEAQVFRNILFHAPDLASQLTPMGHRAALVYFLMRSAALRYPLRSLDGHGLYNMVIAGDTSQDAMSVVRDAIAFQTQVELLSDRVWRLTHRVADQYRSGRVFLAGDAAHTLSPSGGFGMNTGVGDAADLGWKLAAELDRWAGSRLLDTYETERRPVSLDSLEAANTNLKRTMDRDIPIDLGKDTPEGVRARATMAERLISSGARREFDAPEVHFGFRYRSPIVVSDGPAAALPPGWRPGSDPGSRAAHAWVRPGVSTLDLFGRGYTLLRFAESDRLDGFDRAFAQRKVPLRTMACGDRELARLYRYPFVLVRPDGHVAWRGEQLPSAPDELADIVRGAF
ncbi:MAG TPA: FAD-dependent monooxygenase [Amycolatopsis sp.]|uniref:FAD-dependent monooxygenase n=1 Tax=Amycolatopsis sp. TaxID=37632 RepID=UPI002B496464|nr:FAD-dependent monooxygenase [Amycolatopsis sp.]HKS46602.1 FAD-dependent monooxygenase [Amycolatopsis sp.]